MTFPLSNFFNRNKLSSSKSSTNSPSQHIKVPGNNNVVNQVVNNGSPAPTDEQLEIQRRNQLLGQLRNQWLLSNDGISPARMAGLEWGNGERDWVNQQLSSRGESWQV